MDGLGFEGALSTEVSSEREKAVNALLTRPCAGVLRKPKSASLHGPYYGWT